MPVVTDQCLYICREKEIVIYILLYVDDIIIAGDDTTRMEDIKASLKSRFKMKNLEILSYFLGIKITRSEREMFLNQSCYLNRLLVRFNMSNCKPMKYTYRGT